MLWLVVVGGLFITGPCDMAWGFTCCQYFKINTSTILRKSAKFQSVAMLEMISFIPPYLPYFSSITTNSKSSIEEM